MFVKKTQAFNNKHYNKQHSPRGVMVKTRLTSNPRTRGEFAMTLDT